MHLNGHHLPIRKTLDPPPGEGRAVCHSYGATFDSPNDAKTTYYDGILINALVSVLINDHANTDRSRS